MVDNSDFLIAVLDKKHKDSGTTMTINMAKRKGIEILIIDPVTYEVERIPAKIPSKLITE
jgi:nucleoside 2-deoxyribosyltransferase